VEGTKRLLAVAAGTGVSHLVYISIVGIARVRSYPYYRVKLDTERVVQGSAILHTILRATQFCDLVYWRSAPWPGSPWCRCRKG
jgi:uncharacterized protein YbjT (DUF2867 family)